MKKQVAVMETQYFCDICREEISDNHKVCKGCGKDICYSCEYQSSNYCKDCWDEDYLIAEIVTTVERGHGYESRDHIYRTLKKSDMLWHKLMVRFSGKKVKITFEEVKE